MPLTEDPFKFDDESPLDVEAICDQMAVLLGNLDSLGESIAAAHVQMALDTLRKG